MSLVHVMDAANAAASQILNAVRVTMEQQKEAGVVPSCLTVDQFASETDVVMKDVLLAYQQMLTCLESSANQHSASENVEDFNGDLNDSQLSASLSLFKSVTKFSNLPTVRPSEPSPTVAVPDSRRPRQSPSPTVPMSSIPISVHDGLTSCCSGL